MMLLSKRCLMKLELRKDYLLDRWVVIAEKRRDRPKQFSKHETVVKSKDCIFCPGNEASTPGETFRIEKNGKWIIRSFANKFPVVDNKKKYKLNKKGFLVSAYPEGVHEVIVETPYHDKQLADLSVNGLVPIITAWQNRTRELGKDSKYVVLFKNHGIDGGTSIIHSHTQIVSYPRIPTLLMEEIKAYRNYKRLIGMCPYCKIIKSEMRSPRRIFSNKHFASFCPYASRFNYEVWIFPKNHKEHFTEFNEEEIKSLAVMLHKILSKINYLNASYNIVFHKVPEGTDMHFHIEILPRMATWAGFEWSTDEIINSVSPESAAKFYRN